MRTCIMTSTITFIVNICFHSFFHNDWHNNMSKDLHNDFWNYFHRYCHYDSHIKFHNELQKILNALIIWPWHDIDLDMTWSWPLHCMIMSLVIILECLINLEGPCRISLLDSLWLSISQSKRVTGTPSYDSKNFLFKYFLQF